MRVLLNQLDEQSASSGTVEYRVNTYLDYRARNRGIPLKGTFELTPLCNLDCKMCYVHLNEKQIDATGRGVLSGSEWKEIIRQAVEQGMLYALLTGGEAMLHPDFDDIYHYLQSMGVCVSINTNGLLLTKERVAFFIKYRPREVRVTLYGDDDITYEKVTGRSVFSKVIENLRYAKESGLSISVNITPNRYMEGNINKLITLVQSMELPFSVNSSLSEPRKETGRNFDEHDVSLDDYVRLYKHLSEVKGLTVTPECDELPETGGKQSSEIHGFRCGGGKSSFAVVWYGAMQPCLTVQNIQANLRDKSFKECWQQVHNTVCAYPVPIECAGCPYERLCTVCVARHAEGAPLGHANPALCERAKRFVKEGLLNLK